MNGGATHYWRINAHQNGAGPYRDVRGRMDESVVSGCAATTSDGRPPADADPGAASVHVAPAFQAEPNNNSLNFPIGAGIPNQPAPIYAVGGWVKQDSDQPGHGACFLEGSPVNGDCWLCRDASGTLSFALNVVCNNHDHWFIAYGGAALDDGRWHYVLGRYQDAPTAEGELWIDGALAGTAAKPIPAECAGLPQPVQPIRGISLGQNFHGFLSEGAYWQTALSSSYIGPLASVPVGGAYTAAQSAGGGINLCLPCLAASILHGNATAFPIDTSSGNFWHVFTDIKIPGRTYPLAFLPT